MSSTAASPCRPPRSVGLASIRSPEVQSRHPMQMRVATADGDSPARSRRQLTVTNVARRHDCMIMPAMTGRTAAQASVRPSARPPSAVLVSTQQQAEGAVAQAAAAPAAALVDEVEVTEAGGSFNFRAFLHDRSGAIFVLPEEETAPEEEIKDVSGSLNFSPGSHDEREATAVVEDAEASDAEEAQVAVDSLNLGAGSHDDPEATAVVEVAEASDADKAQVGVDILNLGVGSHDAPEATAVIGQETEVSHAEEAQVAVDSLNLIAGSHDEPWAAAVEQEAEASDAEEVEVAVASLDLGANNIVPLVLPGSGTSHTTASAKLSNLHGEMKQSLDMLSSSACLGSVNEGHVPASQLSWDEVESEIERLRRGVAEFESALRMRHSDASS